MELLERSSNLFPEAVNRFPSITQDKIASMSDKLKEADRANNSFGRMNTQFTNQLLTLTMSADSPYRVLRQCLAEIESRRKAIESAYFEVYKHLQEESSLLLPLLFGAQHGACSSSLSSPSSLEGP